MISPPSARLRKARLDNAALIPGSALPEILRYQEMANEPSDGAYLARGSGLIRTFDENERLGTTGGHDGIGRTLGLGFRNPKSSSVRETQVPLQTSPDDPGSPAKLMIFKIQAQ